MGDFYFLFQLFHNGCFSLTEQKEREKDVCLRLFSPDGNTKRKNKGQLFKNYLKDQTDI